MTDPVPSVIDTGRRQVHASLAALAMLPLLAACGRGAARPLAGADGLPLPSLWTITEAEAAAIPTRMQEGVNSLRAAAGAGPVMLDAQLATAAATHSRDMSVQNRPWHFGSDGSSPLTRLARVGYQGALIGQVISETYESDLVTLAAWMEDPATRAVILDPRATKLGIAWYQEPQGRIWWTMVLAA